MRLVLAGASGFLGTALRDHLAREGHDVVRLVRGDAASSSESTWDPYRGQVDQDLVESADVVVNLAGAPIAHWPWTESYKQTLLDSRVSTTGTLAEAIARTTSKPTFLAQNGIDGYGDRGAEVLTEASSTDSEKTLGRITRAWAEATRPASEAGARVCLMRTGVVLDRRGGALKTMLPPFRLGLGGPIGDGRQYFSTITLTDWVRAVTFLATHDDCEGPFNLTGPGATTNLEFTRELGRQLHRPTMLRVPSWPLRKALGELSDELLISMRVEPEALEKAGFDFAHPTLRDRLSAALAS